jgi:hypothetical protein
MVRILCVAIPLIGDADAAGESNGSIDDEHFSMGSIIQFSKAEPAQRVISLDFDARLHHAAEQRAGHFAAAHPIEHQMHFDACRRALNQCFCKSLANPARPIDVGFESNGSSRAPDRREHGGEYFIAVLQCQHLAARQNGGTQQGSHFALQLWIENA